MKRSFCLQALTDVQMETVDVVISAYLMHREVKDAYVQLGLVYSQMVLHAERVS